MTDQKKADIKHLVWIDLEMTGLDPQKHVILEAAVIITDLQLSIIAQGPHMAINQPESALKLMDEWCVTSHTQSGLLAQVKKTDTTIAIAEQQLLSFLREHCEEKKCILAGNSVWMDKMFLLRYMPRLAAFLHYRILDVSSIKVVANAWYPHDTSCMFKKKNSHRALDDITESIEELKKYKENLFK